MSYTISLSEYQGTNLMKGFHNETLQQAESNIQKSFESDLITGHEAFMAFEELSIIKGKPAKIGEIRIHGGIKKRKTAEGWKTVEGHNRHQGKFEHHLAQLKKHSENTHKHISAADDPDLSEEKSDFHTEQIDNHETKWRNSVGRAVHYGRKAGMSDKEIHDHVYNNTHEGSFKDSATGRSLTQEAISEHTGHTPSEGDYKSPQATADKPKKRPIHERHLENAKFSADQAHEHVKKTGGISPVYVGDAIKHANKYKKAAKKAGVSPDEIHRNLQESKPKFSEEHKGDTSSHLDRSFSYE
jgi:hypothetical protein